MQGPVNFKALTPLDNTALLNHASRAGWLGLPELPDFAYPLPGTLRIIANGPSALRAPMAGPTVALNGALRLFTQRDLAPTYWAACDPQELVADFLDDAPLSTHYLVASKCHPKVFERLRGRRVTVWHVAEGATFDLMMNCHPVGSHTSITLTVFEVMERFGWRSFETWGWDGCFMDGRHHAADQSEAGEVISLEVAGKDFRTTGSWALEAQDASQHLARYPWPIAVCGGGMFGAILRQVWAEE